MKRVVFGIFAHKEENLLQYSLELHEYSLYSLDKSE